MSICGTVIAYVPPGLDCLHEAAGEHADAPHPLALLGAGVSGQSIAGPAAKRTKKFAPPHLSIIATIAL
jgi:hypothetical protein